MLWIWRHFLREISRHLNRMVDNKAEQIVATGAHTLAAGDLGCLMNIAGKLSLGAATEVYHVAEILAGMTAAPSAAKLKNTLKSCYASR